MPMSGATSVRDGLLVLQRMSWRILSVAGLDGAMRESGIAVSGRVARQGDGRQMGENGVGAATGKGCYGGQNQ